MSSGTRFDRTRSQRIRKRHDRIVSRYKSLLRRDRYEMLTCCLMILSYISDLDIDLDR